MDATYRNMLQLEMMDKIPVLVDPDNGERLPAQATHFAHRLPDLPLYAKSGRAIQLESENG